MTLLKHAFCYLILSILLASCGSLPGPQTPGTQTEPPSLSSETEEEPGLINENPEDYLQQAQQTTGQARFELLTKAINILIRQKQFAAARQQIDLLSSEYPHPYLQPSIQILQARLALYQGQPREALKRLPMAQILPARQQIEVYQLRAKAFMAAGYPLEAAKTRVQMEPLLTDEFAQQLNHQAIWEALSRLPLSSLRQLSQAPLHPQLLGWIELAKIARSAQTDWQHLQENIFAWQSRYPEHPAARIFAQQLGIKQLELMQHPEHIAVLLPLTGQYASAAAAIRDGLISAYYQHPDKNLHPEISFLDTSHNASAIWNYYRKAVDMGADFIIGPFLKTAVNHLAQASRLEVPTLTLNYAQNQEKLTENMFQFGLLPEDEARQAADMAFRQGHKQAITLVPKGPWGERLFRAFSQRFTELGGQIVNRGTYTPGKNDFKHPIQRLLNIDQSIKRYRQLQRLLKTRLKFTPYRRQDVDMIFMAATPKDARQLKPQFKFHYAGDLPVYATSHAFSGKINPAIDRDLNELYYTDMPWMLTPDPAIKKIFKKYWPEEERLSRFYALGYDAYNLIPYLAQLKAKPYERFSGQTGNIYIDDKQRLHRELLWAQFIKGKPELIELTYVPEEAANDDAMDAKKSRSSP